jgi:hypothetical protein
MMPAWALWTLNCFFILSHVAIIVFTMVGWIFARTRKAHLAFVLLIIFSWLVLGLRYGFGYCFWTEWHWQVREKMGEHNLPNSFVEYMLESFTGHDWNSLFVDWITAMSVIIAGALSAYRNWF